MYNTTAKLTDRRVEAVLAEDVVQIAIVVLEEVTKDEVVQVITVIVCEK